MALLFLGVRTEVGWINETTKIPVIGGLSLFILMFIPAVLLSFLSQTIIPGLNNDVGFTKAMLLLLPGWNFLLWFREIRLYLFFIPSWILFGVIAFIKFILLVAGIDNGQ